MLSPGKDYLKIPKDHVENLEFRIAVLEEARNDRAFQIGLIEICKQDILFWINLFVWQTNPKKKGGGEVDPFNTWPFQDEAIIGKEGILWCIENDEDFVVEKSREMGATWIFLIIMDWLDRFFPYHDSLMMSKSALAVDSPSRQSLFGKLRFLHEHLPLWLHDPKKFIDNKNYFGYPGTNSTATGLSSTGKSGVSERAGEMFFDEFSQVEEDWEVYYRTNSTTGCRMFNGTHMGMGTAFYQLTQDANIKKIQFHWTQHPDKNKGLYRWNLKENKVEFLRYNPEKDQIERTQGTDYKFDPDYEYDQTGNPEGGPHPGVRSPWYDKEFRRIGKNLSEMAKDQDINPKGSVAQFYHPLTIKVLKEEFCYPPLWEGEIEFDPDTGRPIQLIETPGGRIKLWLYPNGGRIPASDYGAGTDVSQGVGKTNSCLSIADGRKGEKVLEFVDPRIEPPQFATLCYALCTLFCNEEGTGAKIAWENHGPGTSFGKRLWKDLNYRQIYYSTREHELAQTVSESPGWSPTKPNRLDLHTKYRTALHNRTFLNHSEKALDETLAFKHIDGSVEHSGYKNKDDPGGAKENHGDIAIADALANKMIEGMLVVTKEKKEALVVADERSIAGRRKLRELEMQETW